MQSVKIINSMRVMKPGHRVHLNLDDLHQQLGGKLYPARPQMLVLTMFNKRKIQIFQGGCVQILGNVSDGEAKLMQETLIEQLTHENADCQLLCTILQLNSFSVANLVIHAQLKNDLCLKNISQSDASLFYEIELFPAALIRKWSPAHVAVFHNGKLIITGVKNLSECNALLTAIENYLYSI